ncbi:MAG: hypothetical protein GX446_18975 [Chthonomonadales bacterium]|nr:hypothetical protein [Chthonomonadales bacterium]
MKRPKISDPQADRQARRLKALQRAAAVCTAAALAIIGIKGGMLYDRFPSSVGATWFELVAVPFAMGLVGVALVLWTLGDRGDRRCACPWTCLAGVCGIGLVAWLAVCLLHSPMMRAGLSVLSIAGVAVGAGLVCAGACRTRRSLTGLAITVAAVGSILAVIGVREYLTQWREGDAAWRIFAGFAVPNFLAGLFVMTIPVSIGLFLRARDRTASLAAAFAVALQVPALLLTQSRLGVMSLVIGLIQFALAAWIARRSEKHGDGRRGRDPHAVRRMALMAVVALVAGLVAARPVISRLRASRDQSYSARFRVMTWEGVRWMVAANPLMGTGTGSFDVRYPGYAKVGYTQHAHNAFLQLAAETGLPGLLLLVGAIVGVAGAGFKGLRRLPRSDGANHDAGMLAAILGGIGAALIHSVFDSDLYVPANAAFFGALCGLAVAWSRPASGAETRTARTAWPAPFILAAKLPSALLGLALIGGSVWALPARSWVAEASAAMAAGDIYGALEAYEHAARLDPFDVENRLALAHVLMALDQPEGARRRLVEATRVANIGKTWYRLGRHDLASGRPADAVKALERACTLDPMHLRSQLTLAQAYMSVGARADALAVYQHMVGLYRSPVGQVRAVPEVVDWEYGIAFAALAEAQLRDRQDSEAISNLRQAADILGRLWDTRHEAMVRLRVQDDAMREATARYEWVLDQLAGALRREHRDADADEVAARHRAMREEKEADAAAER